MKQIVLASTNQGKVREVAMMVQDMGIEIVPLSETAFQEEIEENGKTFGYRKNRGRKCLNYL